MFTKSRVLALGVSITLGCLLACSSSERGEISSNIGTFDAEDAFERSSQVMEGLDSYSLEFTFQPEGEPLTYLVNFAAPADYYERFPAEPDSNEAWELVLHQGYSYGRQCERFPSDCAEWEQSDERLPVPGGLGFTTVAPETLALTALAYAEDPEVIGTEKIDGKELVHIRGTLGLGKVILENKRRVYGDMEDFQESCQSTGNSADGTLEQVCRDVSFEEYAQEEYGDVDFGLEPRSPLHVWVSPDDQTVHRLVIEVPGADGDEPDPKLTYYASRFSRFNEVTVDPPEDFIAAAGDSDEN
jgi:hypothetical protein